MVIKWWLAQRTQNNKLLKYFRLIILYFGLCQANHKYKNRDYDVRCSEDD